MISFLEGTLLISNVILLLLAIIYGFIILNHKKKEDSLIWIYFLIACSLFFACESLDFLNNFIRMNIGSIKAFFHVMFGITVLLAFITKYTKIEN